VNGSKDSLHISRLGASPGSPRYPQHRGLAPQRLMNDPRLAPKRLISTRYRFGLVFVCGIGSGVHAHQSVAPLPYQEERNG
jgi:hypothetical protein